MGIPSLLARIVFVVCFFGGAALTYRFPVDEIFRRQLNCLEDDALLSLQEYPEDSIPFCSTYLGIGIMTSTIPITSRTSAHPYPISIVHC